MASVNPVNPIPVSDKLERKLKLFKRVIEENKSEVIRVREEMKQLIDMKSEEVLRELDSIWTEVNERKKKKRQDIEKDINEVIKCKERMENLILNLNPTVIPKIDLTETFKSVHKEIDIQIPTIQLTWRMNELRDSINKLCSCNKDFVKFPKDTTNKPSTKRVHAYFEDENKTITVKGEVVQSFSLKKNKFEMFYELHTDDPVTFIIRESEVDLNVLRKTNVNYSLLVSANQCAPESDA
ncbi:hypothetical protein LOD99_3717 [Oopsacas minuta]|uniref:Uncharacterized protein n=1 Tax=Oopsacas minuta TaxID=111878 RepID=A0AAV7JW66_9METZ|nr:hypothetical protein LOD99_3717 [Oopsacas minuta]